MLGVLNLLLQPRRISFDFVPPLAQNNLPRSDVALYSNYANGLENRVEDRTMTNLKQEQGMVNANATKSNNKHQFQPDSTKLGPCSNSKEVTNSKKNNNKDKTITTNTNSKQQSRNNSTTPGAGSGTKNEAITSSTTNQNNDQQARSYSAKLEPCSDSTKGATSKKKSKKKALMVDPLKFNGKPLFQPKSTNLVTCSGSKKVTSSKKKKRKNKEKAIPTNNNGQQQSRKNSTVSSTGSGTNEKAVTSTINNDNQHARPNSVESSKISGPQKMINLIKRKTKAQKQDEYDQKWRSLCSAQQEFMDLNPEARCNALGRQIYKAVFTKTISHLGSGPDFFKLSVDNFIEPLTALINAEEAWEHTEMRNYDLKRVTIKAFPSPAKKGQLQYLCTVPGLSRGQPSLIPTDGLIMDDGIDRYAMTILDIDGDKMTFKSSKSNIKVSTDGRKFDISFVSSGICFDRFMEALEFIERNPKFKEILFGKSSIENTSQRPRAKIDFCTSGSQELDTRFSNLNARQKQAIIHIMEAKCRPNLYILFGPPGTGKTFTVVETVVQIYKRDKNAKILICSSSNTCVDSIASSIYDTKQVGSMKRLSSKHHYNQCKSLPDYYTDEAKDVVSRRVVITTNMMVARLPRKVTFDYILIDEAGHAHVLETLIPITRLHQDGCLVLAGDPKQLGPVIKSFEVERLGLGMSLLERMCDLEIYQRKDGNYNEKYITKLVNSYRCDPGILGLCNNIFYHGDLKCLGKTPPSLLKMLHAKKPLMYVRVKGQERSPQSSTSRHNEIEARFCMQILFKLYSMGLEPHQIGIITPYSLQKDMLMNMMRLQARKSEQALNQRFKIPPMKESSSLAEPIASGDPVSKISLDDIDFLTKALTKMKLAASKAQKARQQIENESKAQNGPKMDWFCKVDTVDAFQGSEREVIIVSTVRSPDNYGTLDQCGFLADAKRFNVTISRAKWLVIVVGHPIVLDCCEYWRQFSKHSSIVKFKL